MTTRRDLAPHPDAERSSDYTAELDIHGRWGSGLMLLFSRSFRLPLGYDHAWREGELCEHPSARFLLSAHKGLPWMHMGYVPHAILDAPDGRAELCAILGSFGERHAFGDGTEENFPGYGILRTEPRKRAHELWEDGKVLDVELDWSGHQRRFEEDSYAFELQPGRLRLRPLAPQAPLATVEILVSDAEPGAARLRFTPAPGVLAASAPRLRLRWRALLKRLTRPPLDFAEPIDTLRAPYGFGRFEDLELRPRIAGRELAFEVPELGAETFFSITGGARSSFRLTPAEPTAERFEEGGVRPERAPCWDVIAEIELDASSRPVELALGLRRAGTAVRPRPFRALIHCREQVTEGPHPLRVRTGDRAIDGYVRWALDTARSLIWPNDLITTGSLGYLGKSHVGQDVPFVFPLFCCADLPGFRRAADATLRYVLDGRRRPGDLGIADHPCDAFDFAFAPLDPGRALLWKPFGAAGLLRWVSCLARYAGQCSGIDPVRRWIARIGELVLEHYLPFDPERAIWGRGEETQDALFACATAPRALGELAGMLRAIGNPGAADAVTAAIAPIVDHVNRPRDQGGYWIAEEIHGAAGQRVPGGLLGPPTRLDPTGRLFSFDIPLYNAVALLGDALTPEHRARTLDALLAPGCPWLVPGRGYAKTADGGRGVWYWHNSLLAQAFLEHAEEHPGCVGRARELLTWMGASAVDINGIGIPGEELNGGDHAMGIGCLGVIALLDGLLRPRFSEGGELQLRPVLWDGAESLEVEGYLVRGEPRRIRVHRSPAGLVTEID